MSSEHSHNESVSHTGPHGDEFIVPDQEPILQGAGTSRESADPWAVPSHRPVEDDSDGVSLFGTPTSTSSSVTQEAADQAGDEGTEDTVEVSSPESSVSESSVSESSISGQAGHAEQDSPADRAEREAQNVDNTAIRRRSLFSEAVHSEASYSQEAHSEQAPSQEAPEADLAPSTHGTQGTQQDDTPQHIDAAHTGSADTDSAHAPSTRLDDTQVDMTRAHHTPVSQHDQVSPAVENDAEEPQAEPAWLRRSLDSSASAQAAARNATLSEDDVLLAGSSVVGKPASRAAAHWAGVLIALVFVPAAWFGLHMGAHTLVTHSPTLGFSFSLAGTLTFAAGAVALVIALWMARRSSLGSFVIGIMSLALGLPFLAAPTYVAPYVTPVLERLSTHSTLGENLATFLWRDAASGKFVSFGLLMIMVGVISHSARRAGRREQEVVDRIRRA